MVWKFLGSIMATSLKLKWFVNLTPAVLKCTNVHLLEWFCPNLKNNGCILLKMENNEKLDIFTYYRSLKPFAKQSDYVQLYLAPKE